MIKSLDIINRVFSFFGLIFLALSLLIFVILSMIKTFFKITYKSVKNKFKAKNEKNITMVG